MLDEKSSWTRFTPRFPLDEGAASRLLRTAVPWCRLVRLEPLSGGLCNSNYRAWVEPLGSFVIRLYDRDPGACRREFDILRLVAGAVPVPEVVGGSVDPDPELDRPYLVLRYVEGVSLRDLRSSGDRQAIAQAARSAGATLAAIGRFSFPSPGWFGPDLSIGGRFVEGEDPFMRLIETCLESPVLQGRMDGTLRGRVAAHARFWNDRVARLDGERRLVHADFNSSNLLVRRAGGRWTVAAVLDWEFALSGAPLLDVGNFLRYERESRPLVEPHFSEGYVAAGGALHEDWRGVARALDLTALCEILTRAAATDLVAREVVGLVEETVCGSDPAEGGAR